MTNSCAMSITIDGYLRNGQVVDANGAPVGHTIKVRASEGYGPMARTYVTVRWAGTLFTGSIPNGSDHVTLKAVSPDFQSSLLREYVERWRKDSLGSRCDLILDIQRALGGHAEGCNCFPHGPADPCTCEGCWACDGHVLGCTCDIDWDCEHQP